MIPGRYYVPYTDTYETDETLTLVMEMPGLEKKDLGVALENNVLRVDGPHRVLEVRRNGAGAQLEDVC